MQKGENTMNPSSIKLSYESIANSDYGIAVNVINYFNYVDGKPSGDTPAGIRVDVVLPNNRYEKISVKLPGLNHVLTPDAFQEPGVSYKVKFSADFEGRFYRTPSGDYVMTCKASEIEVIK